MRLIILAIVLFLAGCSNDEKVRAMQDLCEGKETVYKMEFTPFGRSFSISCTHPEPVIEGSE
jgi:PBP1b-binding outer membrane lipoprotein LpoB